MTFSFAALIAGVCLQPGAPSGLVSPFCQLLDTPLGASASAHLHTPFASSFVSARSSPKRRLTGVFYVPGVFAGPEVTSATVECPKGGLCMSHASCDKETKKYPYTYETGSCNFGASTCCKGE